MDETDDVTPAAESAGHSGYVDRIRDLAADAREARASLEPVADGDNTEIDGVAVDRDRDDTVDERALRYARDGVGPVVALYIEARTAERDVEFSAKELDLLHRALNDWLALYARCYGVDLDASFSVREAAELLLRTHNIRDTAQLLTCVPSRRD